MYSCNYGQFHNSVYHCRLCFLCTLIFFGKHRCLSTFNFDAQETHKNIYFAAIVRLERTTTHYSVGTRNTRLGKTVLLSTHNIGFWCDNRVYEHNIHTIARPLISNIISRDSNSKLILFPTCSCINVQFLIHQFKVSGVVHCSITGAQVFLSYLADNIFILFAFRHKNY